MKVTKANDTEACLIYCADGKYRLRVYESPDEFVDYDILHSDLRFIITDPDAYLYTDGEKHWIDHGPETLGLANHL